MNKQQNKLQVSSETADCHRASYIFMTVIHVFLHIIYKINISNPLRCTIMIKYLSSQTLDLSKCKFTTKMAMAGLFPGTFGLLSTTKLAGNVNLF